MIRKYNPKQICRLLNFVHYFPKNISKNQAKSFLEYDSEKIDGKMDRQTLTDRQQIDDF